MSVKVEWETPLSISSDIFLDSSYNNATLYVPVGCMAAYQSADVWKNFGTIVAIAEITGDINSDAKVDIADAVTVLNIMAAGDYSEAADVNGDDKIDIADFVTILNIMAEQ